MCRSDKKAYDMRTHNLVKLGAEREIRNKFPEVQVNKNTHCKDNPI